MSPSPSTTLAALARTTLLALSAATRPAAAEDIDAPPPTVLVLSARCVSSGNAFAYFRFARTEFLIEEGDVLEYSLYVDGSSPLPRGGVDIYCAGGATLRDSGATDEEGRSAHGDADLADANDRWLARRIPLAPLAGRIAHRFVIGCEGDVPGTYVQYVDDVAISNAKGERRVIFSDGFPDLVELESSKGYDTIFSGVAAAPRRESYARGRVPILLAPAAPPDDSAPKKGPRFRTVNLAALRDRRGIAGDDGDSADFDGSGHAFPAGELPAEPTILSGVPFDLPPAGGVADHVSAHGQVIDLRPAAPGTTFLAILLAASRSSSFEAPLVFVNEGGSSVGVPLAVPAWTESNADSGSPSFEFSHRAGPSGRVLGPTRLGILTVPVALASPAAALKLPETPDLRIFSITLRPLGPTEIDDEFRIGFIARTVRTPESADYLRNYRFAKLLPEFLAEEGRLRRLYDLAVEGDESAFRSALLERLTRFTEAGAKHKALSSRVTAWLDLSRPPRTGAPEAVERATDLLRLVNSSDDVTCAISGVAALDAISVANPQLLAEMKRLAIARRIEFASVAWALPRPNRAGGETLVRNLLEGQRFLAAKFGSTGRMAALLAEDDIPPTLPQILRKSGADYAIFLPATGQRAVPEEIRSGAIGRWEGTDGSRVFGVGPAGHPEGAIAPETLLDAPLAVERRHGYKDALILFGAAADTERVLGSLRDAAASRLLPKVRFDRVESFCDAIASDREIEPPITRGEPFAAAASGGGPAPRSGATSRARSAEAALVAAESLRATLPQDDPSDLAALWRSLVVSIAGDPDESGLAPAEAEARAALASAAARVASLADTSGAGGCVVVVNPLGFEREETVELPLPSTEGVPSRVVDELGAETLSQPIGGGERALVSVAVPPFSCRVLRVEPEGGDGAPPRGADVPASDGAVAAPDAFRLENRFVRVSIDPVSGRIASLFDKTSGRETLGGAAGGPAGTLLVAGTGGSGDDGVRLSSASVIEAGPIRAAVALEFETASGPALRQTIRLDAASPRVRVEIDWTGRPKGASAAMKIPLAGPGPFTTLVEAPFGAAERAFPLPGSTWIDSTGAEGAGVALFAGRGAAIGVADAGALSVTADDRAEFALVPHGAAGGALAASPARHAHALLVPLVVVAEPAHAGVRAAAAAPWVALSGGSGALVEGLRRSSDGAGTVVRLRETNGAPADALLRFGWEVGEAAEADLLERPTGRAFPARGADVPVGLAPFEIQTILVRPAK